MNNDIITHTKNEKRHVRSIEPAGDIIKPVSFPFLFLKTFLFFKAECTYYITVADDSFSFS